MPSFNKVVMIGRLTRDPELRHLASGMALASFSIAVDRKFKKDGQTETDFFRCKAWRKTAEFVAEHVGKGRLVCVEGRLETSEHTGNDGVKKYFTDIVCDSVELLDAQKQTPSDGGSESDDDPFGGEF